MSEPSHPRPLPGPGRPVPGPLPTAGGSGRPAPTQAGEQPTGAPEPADRFGGLGRRPVSEHVDVFEAEHDRLQAELGTIDRL
jgi:hypothetical protein